MTTGQQCGGLGTARRLPHLHGRVALCRQSIHQHIATPHGGNTSINTVPGRKRRDASLWRQGKKTSTPSPSQRSKGPHPRHVGDPAPMHRSHVEHSIRTPDTWGVARSPHWRSRARTVNAFNRSSAGVHRGLSRYDVFCRCCSGKLGWPCQEVLVFPLRGNWMTRLTAWRAWASLGQHFASVRGREHCLACGVGPPSPSSLAAPVYGLPALRCRSRLVAHASLPSVSPRRARQHTPGTQCTAAACTPPQQPSRTEFARVPATVDAGSNGCMTTKPSAASVSLPRSRSTTHSASTTVTTLARVDAFGEQSVP